MKRIFYYSGYRLTVFHWQDNECVAQYAFNPGEEGIDKFATYLKATTNTPVRILVDLIEEDFNKETIPHVGYVDRKSIMARIVDRHYRQSQDYVNYKVINREASGRKDDIVLYSVLSNPSILEPWLKPMRESGTAISGIWSLPLLTNKLYKHLDAYTDNILIVSQQVPSNLRQTFLRNGRFESSRSAVVNLEEASIGEYIAIEIEQTIRFLSNQRHIGFDEKIEIHIICRDEDIPDIQSKCIDGTLRIFRYHKLDEFQEKLGCMSKDSEYCNSIYTHACASLPVSIGHYGNRQLFQKYYEQLASTSLYVASITLLVLSIIFSISFYSESSLLDQEAETLTTQANAINRDYQKNLSGLEKNLEQSQLMQSSVLLSEKIVSSKMISPQNFMSDISKLLAKTNMRGTEITKFSWRQNQNIKPPAGAQRASANIINYSSDEPIYHVATLGGHMQDKQITVKQSVIKANTIIDAIKNGKRITNLKIISMPVDVRSESSVEQELGFDKNTLDAHDKDFGSFDFEVTMDGRKS